MVDSRPAAAGATGEFSFSAPLPSTSRVLGLPGGVVSCNLNRDLTAAFWRAYVMPSSVR